VLGGGKTFAKLLKERLESIIYKSIPGKTGYSGSFYLACKTGG